jgi:hypothetical protein
MITVIEHEVNKNDVTPARVYKSISPLNSRCRLRLLYGVQHTVGTGSTQLGRSNNDQSWSRIYLKMRAQNLGLYFLFSFKTLHALFASFLPWSLPINILHYCPLYGHIFCRCRSSSLICLSYGTLSLYPSEWLVQESTALEKLWYVVWVFPYIGRVAAP